MSINITKLTNEIELKPHIIEFFKNFNTIVEKDFLGSILLYDARIYISEHSYKFVIEFHMDKFDDRQKYERIYERGLMANPICIYEEKFKESFNKHLIIEQYKIFQKQMDEEKLKSFNEMNLKLFKI